MAREGGDARNIKHGIQGVALKAEFFEVATRLTPHHGNILMTFRTVRHRFSVPLFCIVQITQEQIGLTEGRQLPVVKLLYACPSEEQKNL